MGHLTPMFYMKLVVQYIIEYSCESCINRLSHQCVHTEKVRKASAAPSHVSKWPVSRQARCVTTYRGRSAQFSLRISFAKQHRRNETDRTGELQAVTRHLDLGSSAGCGDVDRRDGRVAWKPTDDDK